MTNTLCLCLLFTSPLEPFGSRFIDVYKHKVSHFYFYFCRKMKFRTYFVYFQPFSSKFKVQRTPTEFGLPVGECVRVNHVCE